MPTVNDTSTDLLIVGAGAAGLMAAATAAELGLRTVLVERKHLPGRKLLMCGNNRCNLTSDLGVEALVEAYAPPVGPFLRIALSEFTPGDLRTWFAMHGVRTNVHKDGRVFPLSENADDVLHLFTDLLRDREIPIALNCPVTGIVPTGDILHVRCPHVAFHARHVLVATGGVSYPKTGSVGDGQKMAKELGHKLVPYRPGLAGFDMAETWLAARGDAEFPGATLTIFEGRSAVAETKGEILFTRRGARGPSMVDASRIVSRRGLRDVSFEADLCPAMSVVTLTSELARRFSSGARQGLAEALAGWLLPPPVAGEFVRQVIGMDPKRRVADLAPSVLGDIAKRVKHWPLRPQRIRPLKEAMVTIGGVSLEDIDPNTMESLRCPGLFFAGEVMDIDGPTGGFNLHAAFATARLAVCVVAGRLGTRPPPVRPERGYRRKRKPRRCRS